jgi:hypothetical protein
MTHWRERAAQLRVIADGFANKALTATLQRLADDYDKMAERAEDRAKNGVNGVHPPSAAQTVSKEKRL